MMLNAQPKTKRYAAENDLFPFYVLCLVTKKTSNTGTEKLWSRILKPRFLTNPLLESF